MHVLKRCWDMLQPSHSRQAGCSRVGKRLKLDLIRGSVSRADRAVKSNRLSDQGSAHGACRLRRIHPDKASPPTSSGG